MPERCPAPRARWIVEPVERVITAFHQDVAGDWIAELSCGHNQHVRHRPPFQLHPWVVDHAGRSTKLGSPLDCPLCDRGELPLGLRRVRTSPEWTEQSMPAGLRRRHRLASGTWGQITIHEGRLRLTMGAQPSFEVGPSQGDGVLVIPPEVEHDVHPVGAVRFTIDLSAVDRGSSEDRSGGASEQAADRGGGDPACWAALLCPECGAVLDRSAHRADCPIAPR